MNVQGFLPITFVNVGTGQSTPESDLESVDVVWNRESLEDLFPEIVLIVWARDSRMDDG